MNKMKSLVARRDAGFRQTTDGRNCVTCLHFRRVESPQHGRCWRGEVRFQASCQYTCNHHEWLRASC